MRSSEANDIAGLLESCWNAKSCCNGACIETKVRNRRAWKKEEATDRMRALSVLSAGEIAMDCNCAIALCVCLACVRELECLQALAAGAACFGVA